MLFAELADEDGATETVIAHHAHAGPEEIQVAVVPLFPLTLLPRLMRLQALFRLLIPFITAIMTTIQCYKGLISFVSPLILIIIIISTISPLIIIISINVFNY